MPEIYADWKSLEPLNKRVPTGTKCVVIDREEQDKFVLGEVVTVEDSDACPYCSNTDGVCDVMRVIELALLPSDYQAEPKGEQPAPTKQERKVVHTSCTSRVRIQYAEDPNGNRFYEVALEIVATCDDGSVYIIDDDARTWHKLPPIPQD